MLPELGVFALVIALCFALIQIAIPLFNYLYNNTAYISLARWTANGQFIFIGISYIILTIAFASNDFSVSYVAANSHTQLPLIYRICAVWGGHEGSLLLWVCLLSFWGMAINRYYARLQPETFSRVMAIMGFVSVGFLWFLLGTSSPFERLLPIPPVDGQSLNPLLQDPGFIIHPPMLYMGYVGYAVVFAFGMSALITGKADSQWAQDARPWALLAWAFLTLGITLGSWWAYNELGWGGWWFWDPVENASFLPWLVGTALLHSLIVTEKTGGFSAWSILLAIIAFALSLMGTFLVRSGILTSVHAFATDPERGVYLLLFLCVIIIGSLLIYAVQASKIKNTSTFYWLSRESFLLANNVLLLVAMLTVLLGTLYPLIIDALGLGKISVGMPYFNAVFVPIVIPLFFLMAIGPIANWHAMQPSILLKRLRVSFFLSILLAILLPWCVTGDIRAPVFLGLFLASWIVLSSVQYLWYRRTKMKRNYIGMAMAHIGIAVTIVGIVLSSAYSVEREMKLSLADSALVGPYEFHYLTIADLKGPNYKGATAHFVITKDKIVIREIDAEKRYYEVSKMGMTESAVDAGLFRDLYIAMGEPLEGSAWSFRFYYKPFVRWIWGGGLLMLLGGLLSYSDIRRRRYE